MSLLTAEVKGQRARVLDVLAANKFVRIEAHPRQARERGHKVIEYQITGNVMFRHAALSTTSKRDYAWRRVTQAQVIMEITVLLAEGWALGFRV